ncbi:DeoR/GlpR family DNA-binding transcription regulator [Aurantimonas sp. Leaf443]|uniref:DeoR/GlpR family DNA-binding transcription regulator n=1 Tax=Aurantimonas sp. Leaf443 TaxID=1736378 RepID=UPI0006F862B3|nr:DeoR/GlpR family DNA-binding transcription regulator [Aurantimonas sp. Leaf443]KQT85606.1 hypothetical protein ASG48_07840 [Aurantimonas sp. Leaf443]
MSLLLTRERQSRIAERLGAEGQVRAGALAAEFGVSEDTIRRDLREMAAEGLCRRVYGGAVPAAPVGGTLQERRREEAPRKARLGERLACTILPGSSLFVDAGSTNLCLAAALPADAGLTVVTNAPDIAALLLSRGGFEIVLVGGRVDPRCGACLGATALRDLERFRFDDAVLGACGLDAGAGLTAHLLEEAEFKAAVATRARRILAAATNDKIGTAAAYCVLPASRLSRVALEADCPAALVDALKAAGIDVLRADPCDPAPIPVSLRRARAPTPA